MCVFSLGPHITHTFLAPTVGQRKLIFLASYSAVFIIFLSCCPYVRFCTGSESSREIVNFRAKVQNLRARFHHLRARLKNLRARFHHLRARLYVRDAKLNLCARKSCFFARVTEQFRASHKTVSRGLSESSRGPQNSFAREPATAILFFADF